MPLPESPPTGILPFEPPKKSAPDLAEFWQLWREEKFWACHEALEDVWREETEPRKRGLQGLIHGAVAVFQARRGNEIGAKAQLEKAHLKLKDVAQFEGVEIEAFLSGIEKEINYLTADERG